MTILQNLNSLDGGEGGREGGGRGDGGKGGWVGVLKVKDRFVGGKKGGSDLLPGASSMYEVFFHKLCEIFFLRSSSPRLEPSGLVSLFSPLFYVLCIVSLVSIH